MEFVDGHLSFFVGTHDFDSEPDCDKHKKFFTPFGDSLPYLGQQIPQTSDTVALQPTLRSILLNLFVLECPIPSHRDFGFRELHPRATQRNQQIPLVGVLPQQQRHDSAHFNAIRSLRHGNTRCYYVCKRMHESVRPALWGLQFLFERGREHRSRLVGLLLRQLCWVYSLGFAFFRDLRLPLSFSDSLVRLGNPFHLFDNVQFFPNQHVPLILISW